MSSDSESDSGSEGRSGGVRGLGKKFKEGGKDKHKEKDKKEKKEKKGKKDKKEKKDKKDQVKAHESAHGHPGSSTFSGPGYGPVGGGAAEQYLSSTTSSTVAPAPAHFQTSAPIPAGQAVHASPPPYATSPDFPQSGVDIKQPQFPGMPSTPAANAPPPSGYRVPLRTDSSFPGPDQTGPPVAYESDGVTPVFIGSALFETSVHPCKIGPHLQPPASVAYGGAEYGHHGRYDLLPFVSEQMEWVYASYGQVPPGRRPIEGGYEENGAKLYHALASINGIRVPGKAGEHLGGANIALGGQEHVVQQYEILCWK